MTPKFLVLVLAAVTVAVATAQTPVFRTGTAVVDIPAIVFDKSGQPVRNLTRDNFRLRDNAGLQRLGGFDAEPRPLSLAVVVDLADDDAIAQAKRAAELLDAMVVGADGDGCVIGAGLHSRQLSPFGDESHFADTLHHLTRDPTPSQHSGDLTEALLLALRTLRQQPRERTRAALVIARNDSNNLAFAQAVVESSMGDSVLIFQISPNHPDGEGDYANPVDPATRGGGQGSQREPQGAPPVDARGQPPDTGSGSAIGEIAVLGGMMAARAAIGAVGNAVMGSHNMDYVRDSGGTSARAGNDREFDRDVDRMGAALRAIYHLGYQPDDLTADPTVHQVEVEVVPANKAASITFRRMYVAAKPK